MSISIRWYNSKVNWIKKRNMLLILIWTIEIKNYIINRRFLIPMDQKKYLINVKKDKVTNHYKFVK